MMLHTELTQTIKSMNLTSIITLCGKQSAIVMADIWTDDEFGSDDDVVVDDDGIHNLKNDIDVQFADLALSDDNKSDSGEGERASEPIEEKLVVVAADEKYNVAAVYRQACAYLHMCNLKPRQLFSDLPDNVVADELTVAFALEGDFVLVLWGEYLGDNFAYVVELDVMDELDVRLFHLSVEPKTFHVIESETDVGRKLMQWNSSLQENEHMTYSKFNLTVNRAFTEAARVDSFLLYLNERGLAIDNPGVNIFNGAVVIPPSRRRIGIAEEMGLSIEDLFATSFEFDVHDEKDAREKRSIVIVSQSDAAAANFSDSVVFVLNRGPVIFSNTNIPQMHYQDFLQLHVDKPISPCLHEEYESGWYSMQAYAAAVGAYLPPLDDNMRRRFFNLSETIILRLPSPSRPLVFVIVSQQISNSNVVYNATGGFDENKALACAGSMANGTSEGVTLVVMRKGVSDTASDMQQNNCVLFVRIEDISVLRHQESAIPQPINKERAEQWRQLHLGRTVRRFKKPKEMPLIEATKRGGLLYTMAIKRAQVFSH